MSESQQAAPNAPPGSMLPPEECDKLRLRLHHAINGFVDEPWPAVEQAGELLDDLALRIGELLDERLSVLRQSWQAAGGESGTEELRYALCAYRDLTERLLRL